MGTAAIVIGIVDTLLSITDKVMDHLPNYEQRKKKEFRSLRMAYDNEKSKDPSQRDDNLVGVYRDRLLLFVSIFEKEMSE